MASTSRKSVRQEGVGWSALLDGGRLRAFVDRMFPLAQAREAYAHARQSGHRGKTVVRMETT